MFGFFRKKRQEETVNKVVSSEYKPDHTLDYSNINAQMEEIDLSQAEFADVLNKSESDNELSETELDMKRNPEKYMEQEIREIEEDEKRLIEAEEKRDGKPLDIQTWELLHKEREERKAKRIKACREKWLGQEQNPE